MSPYSTSSSHFYLQPATIRHSSSIYLLKTAQSTCCLLRNHIPSLSGDIMAPRRTHKKSRNGCRECKRRHLKVRSAFYLIRVFYLAEFTTPSAMSSCLAATAPVMAFPVASCLLDNRLLAAKSLGALKIPRLAWHQQLRHQAQL